MTRVIDDPAALMPALAELACRVKDFVASGRSLAVVAELSVEEAAAVLLAAEALAQTTPDGVDPATWAGVWLLSFEMQAGGS